jgi:hypothetical protein
MTIKKLLQDEFGGGIMSAIDFSMDIVRKPCPQGRPRECVVGQVFAVQDILIGTTPGCMAPWRVLPDVGLKPLSPACISSGPKPIIHDQIEALLCIAVVYAPMANPFGDGIMSD